MSNSNRRNVTFAIEGDNHGNAILVADVNVLNATAAAEAAAAEAAGNGELDAHGHPVKYVAQPRGAVSDGRSDSSHLYSTDCAYIDAETGELPKHCQDTYEKEDQIQSIRGLRPPFVGEDEHICLLDIDVQGHEVHVFQGLEQAYR